MNYKTLEEILSYEKAHRHEEGIFGIKACKEHIIFTAENLHESLFTQLQEYYEKSINPFFNNAMILACWELINDTKNIKLL